MQITMGKSNETRDDQRFKECWVLKNSFPRSGVNFWISAGTPSPPNARKIPRFQTTYFLKIRLRTTQTGSEDTGKRIRAADIPHKQHIRSTPQSVK